MKDKKIDIIIECPKCNGTGLYRGMGEGDGIAVICDNCNGTGKYNYIYQYNEFNGRKCRDNVKRIYKCNYGYRLRLGNVTFKNIDDTKVVIDMDKEGISYQEFLNGKYPEHIRKLACPLLADQCECQDIDGFVEKCYSLNGGYLGYIPNCKYTKRKDLCWDRFDKNKSCNN